jgi:hypothetical protein
LWHGLALGALMVAALLTDFQIALFTALWLALYAVWRLRPAHAPSLMLGAGVAGVMFVVVFGGTVQALSAALGGGGAFAGDGYPRPGLRDMQVYSFRVWDFVDPAVASHAYGLELGVAAAAFLLLWRKANVWLIGAAAFLVLSLGPFLQPTSMPLPFAPLGLALGQFRTPYRLAMPAALGLAVVLGIVLARWSVSSRSGVAVALVAARLGAALILEPMTTQTYPRYVAYERLRAEAERFTVLEVPVGIRSGLEQIGQGGEVLQIYQHVHGKPLVNGMIARLPARVFSTYRESPALLLLSGEPVTATADDMRALVDWTGARYIVVHRDMLAADQQQRVEALVAEVATVDTIEGELVVYRLTVPPRAA